jgi:hypothetical protein
MATAIKATQAKCRTAIAAFRRDVFSYRDVAYAIRGRPVQWKTDKVIGCTGEQVRDGFHDSDQAGVGIAGRRLARWRVQWA